MNNLISVIIPVYNKGSYLKRSITSVLNQTYSNLELIVINDGSTDCSEEILLSYNEDKRIKYLKLENGGVSKARNIGLRMSSGEFVCFLDADDYYEKDFLEQMLKSIGEYNVCYCLHNYVRGEKQLRCKIDLAKNDIITNYFLNKTTPNTNSWLLRREFLVENELFFEEELDWGEDMLFFSKILTLDIQVQYNENYLTNYDLGVPNSLSTNDLNKVKKDLRWIDEYKSFLEKVNQSSVRKQKIKDVIESYFIPALVLYRIFSNKEKISIQEFEELKVYFQDFKFNNGLRSFKLGLYKLFLENYFRLNKGRI